MTRISGSYALYLQGRLRNCDKPSDIDVIAVNDATFNRVVKALDSEGIEKKFETVNEIIFGFMSHDVLEFYLDDQKVDVFNGNNIGNFLSGDLSAASKLNFDDHIVYVRPVELIKSDFRKVLAQYHPNTEEPIIKKKIAKYQERLDYLNAPHC